MDIENNQSQLLALIENGRYKDIGPFFKNMVEDERAEFADLAVTQFKKYFKNIGPSLPCSDVQKASIHAVMCAASAEQITNLNWSMNLNGLGFDHLTGNKRPALKNFGNILARDAEFLFSLAPEIFELYAFDLIDEPNYYNDRLLISMMHAKFFYRKLPNPQDSFTAWLKTVPCFLEYGIWRFFEVEGEEQHTLVKTRSKPNPLLLQHVKIMFPGDEEKLRDFATFENWDDALIKLADEKIISRDRLLRESLNALNRGFRSVNCVWFSQFHEALQPTIYERGLLTEKYLGLLNNQVSSTVTLALKALQKIAKKAPLQIEALESNLQPCLVSSYKSTVLSALDLLNKTLAEYPQYAPRACLLAAEALQSQDLEVQTVATTMLKQYCPQPDQALRDKLLIYVEVLAPSAAKTANELLGDAAVGPTKTTAICAYKMEQTQLPGWPLSCEQKLNPIEDAETLFTKALYCLEHPEEVLEIEMVIDAVARLALKQVEDISPLVPPIKARARAVQSSKSQFQDPLQELFANFLVRWLTGEYVWLDTDRFPATLLLLEKKMDLVLANLGDDISLLPISTPTHRGGWIEPQSLLERARLWQDKATLPDIFDLTLALLRTPPEARPRLANASELPPQLMRAFRYLTDLDSLADKLLPPLHDAALFSKPPVNTSHQLIVGSKSLFVGNNDLSTLRLLHISAPALRDMLCNVGVRETVQMINWGQAASDRGVKGHFEFLTASGAPLERRALIMFAIGLHMADPESASFTRDALILAIDEKRLDTEKLGREVSAFLYSGYSKPKRVSQSLQEIARVSNLHADAVRQIIEFAIPSSEKHVPTGFVAILELLSELLTGSGRTLENEATREKLQIMISSGRSGKLIQKLLR